MRNRLVRRCLLAIAVTPLFAACGDSGEKQIIPPDGSVPMVDATLADLATTHDLPLTADLSLGIDQRLAIDVAPIPVDVGADAPIIPAIDAAAVDVGAGVDVAAVDLAPAVCLENPRFTGGSVTKDTTLAKACSPYTIKSTINVEGNATLTIEPGVVVKFETNASVWIGHNSVGKLVAQGTAADPITLTSAASFPAAGDWEGLHFWDNAMAGNVVSYVSLANCGKGGAACLLADSGVNDGAVTIDHVVIDRVGGNANGIEESSAFTITNTTFKAGAIKAGNYAISLDADSMGAVGTGNVFNGAPIEIAGGTVTTTATWLNQGTPLVVTRSFIVEATASPILTLTPGTVLQFADATNIWVGHNAAGQLVAEGTATAPITFTSKNATPGSGDWDGIHFWDATANGSKLAYVKLDYCGRAIACIYADEVKPGRLTVDHAIIDHVGTSSNGIDVSAADSRVAISNTTFPVSAIATGHYAISVDASSFAAIGAGNVFNGAMVEVRGGTIATGIVSWVDPGTVVAVTRSLEIEGAATPELKLGPGMTLKFAADARFWVAQSAPGKLSAVGTAAARVKLTSLAASPGPGDWPGITVWEKGQLELAYVDLSYAGAVGSGAVEMDAVIGTVNITNSTISYSAGYGVYVHCDNTTTTVDATNTFTSNAYGARGPDCS